MHILRPAYAPDVSQDSLLSIVNHKWKEVYYRDVSLSSTYECSIEYQSLLLDNKKNESIRNHVVEWKECTRCLADVSIISISGGEKINIIQQNI